VFNQFVIALIFDTLVSELVTAPQDVQDLLTRLLKVGRERLSLTPEAIMLRDVYLQSGVVIPSDTNSRSVVQKRGGVEGPPSTNIPSSLCDD
jgi:hypothetical protein